MNALHISHHIYAVHCILHSHHTDYLNVACVQDPGYTKNMCVRLRKEKCDSEKQNGTTKIFQIRATALFPSDSFFPFLSLSLAAPSFLLLFIWSLLPPFYLSSYFYGRSVSLPSPIPSTSHFPFTYSPVCCWLFVCSNASSNRNYWVLLQISCGCTLSEYGYENSAEWETFMRVAISPKETKAATTTTKRRRRRRWRWKRSFWMYFAEIERSNWEQNHTASK